jgi:hypothetical protein
MECEVVEALKQIYFGQEKEGSSNFYRILIKFVIDLWPISAITFK